MTELVKRNDTMDTAIEQVVIDGNLTKLEPRQRVDYYRKVCESLGLNPLTKPFDYITLNGKLTLYARKDATEQLRKIHGVSILALDGKMVEGLYIVTAVAHARDGRTDQAQGAVNLEGLKGEAKANAIMKCETKAKRRVTLSIVGLGWTDESEVDSIPGAQIVRVDTATGEIIEAQATHRGQRAPEVSRETRVPEVSRETPEDDNPFENDVDFGMPDVKHTAYVWPVKEEELKLVARLIHAPITIPELSFRLMSYLMKADSESGDKRLSDKQYGLLAGKLDARYGKPAHRAILAACCQRVVTLEDAPGWKCKELIDWLMKPDENAAKVSALDGVVSALKEASMAVA